MAGPNEAYGIFSVQRFKCVPIDSSSPNTCLSKYQLQAVTGDCYLNILNESGSKAAQQRSLIVYRALQKKIDRAAVSLPLLMRHAALKPFLRNLIIAYGPLGLQNGYPDWLPYFENFESFTLYLLPVEFGGNNLVIAHANIPCCGEGDEFVRLAGFDAPLTESLMAVTKEGYHLFARKITKQTIMFAVGSGSASELGKFLEEISKE